MNDLVEKFFAAWGKDPSVTAQTIAGVLAEDALYADPRSQGVMQGPEAVSKYVEMFGAQAPGWTATVVKKDRTADCIRATVAFGGPGPDGKQTVQHGQYFVDIDGTHITRMIGFVGTGGVEE